MSTSIKFAKEDLKKIGIRMHTARVLTGMSRDDFAVKYDISSMSIKNWELGRVLPRNEGILSLLKAYKECGVLASPEWILFGSGVGPNYSPTASTETNLYADEFIDEQMKLFKKAQRAKGFNPIVVHVASNMMDPGYKQGDLLGGIMVSPEFVKKEIGQEEPHAWLITNAQGQFIPASVYLFGDRWFINTKKDSTLKECISPSIAKIKWHYAIGDEI